MKQNVRRLILWTIVVLISAAIFSFSAQPASESAALSGEVTGGLYGVLRRIFPGLRFSDWETAVAVVRKLAHFFLYFSLSVSSFFAIRTDVEENRRAALISFLFCFLYAVSDEVHQAFVPGRAMLVTDVFIDSAGALLGLLSAVLFLRLIERRAKRK
ncbi:MAG: VanZ family protein [Clostridia bacterium]|nr:VanZ family protein [Clostridia bacterium]